MSFTKWQDGQVKRAGCYRYGRADTNQKLGFSKENLRGSTWQETPDLIIDLLKHIGEPFSYRISNTMKEFPQVTKS